MYSIESNEPLLSVQEGETLDITVGDIWGGRNLGGFVAGKPASATDIELHIAASKGLTHHGFYTVPSRILGENYTGSWRGSIVRATYTSSENVTVKLIVYPVDNVIPGNPVWEIDNQSFNGVSSSVEFIPPLGAAVSQRVLSAGSRLEMKGISLGGAQTEAEGRMFLQLTRDSTTLERDLAIMP